MQDPRTFRSAGVPVINKLAATMCALLATLTGWGVTAPPAPAAKRWVRIDYGALIDGRKLTHSGEPVGVLMTRLGGRPMPAPGERREDALAYRLLDPILEPYAFVLADALDASGAPHDPPWVEVGSLWETGEAQPAWVELVRARQLSLESDGEGHLRACLPAPSLARAPGDPLDREDPVAAAKEAWEAAWPVLRHALAGERSRLARVRGSAPPALSVEVHAYRHIAGRSLFDLGVAPWQTSVTETGAHGGRAALDLAALQSILERGLTLEGARLESSGRIRWFASDPETKPALLGRAPTLADVAVAYRAVARGGNGEPYMSLDRASAPHVADVNYGGRLRDTALGMVSLLSDVRFKTFSVGIDLLGDGDVRDAVRRSLPEWRTHLERFASDPTAGAVLNQQTRFWFYPDDVDLTLSEAGDVLAFRKVRMSAASERVRDAGAAASDPAWTQQTVSFLNGHYDAFASIFPEMADLDESVRLLALFTWLQSAKDRGLAVPDLDVLLALPLPAIPTPRRFPQLLSHDVLPAPGATGVVDVLDRTSVGQGLDRLEPRGVRPLPAAARFARDLAMLSPQVPDQSALAKEMSAPGVRADATGADLLSYRAERLLMHARVLATIPEARRDAIEGRRAKEPATRVFSVGIGGVDLGMGAVLARATKKSGRLGMAAGESGTPAGAPSEKATAEPPAAAPAPSTVPAPADPLAIEWPDHGLGPAAERSVTASPDQRSTTSARRRPGALVRTGTFKVEAAPPVTWQETVLGMEGPEVRARRVIFDPKGGATVFQRVEDERFVSYRLEGAGNALRAVPSPAPIPAEVFAPVAPPAGSQGAAPPALTVMDLVPAAGEPAAADAVEPVTVAVRLRGGDGRERVASIPRALMQRLVRGRELDTTPDRPLPAFTPASAMLGTSRGLMVLASADETRAPWTGATPLRPGEEDAARLAAALTRWWSTDGPSTAGAVVGVDPAVSPARWAKASPLDGTIAVIAPEDAFPWPARSLRPPLSKIAAQPAAKLVLVVSAEAPGLLGRRLRQMATDPQFDGKTLAVVSCGGPMRADLPASLLAEGHLAAVGVYEAGPVGLTRSVSLVAGWAGSVGSDAAKGRRVEEVAGPFTWFY